MKIKAKQIALLSGSALVGATFFLVFALVLFFAMATIEIMFPNIRKFIPIIPDDVEDMYRFGMLAGFVVEIAAIGILYIKKHWLIFWGVTAGLAILGLLVLISVFT